MTIGSFFWGVIIPTPGRNLISNPSFETGTTTWAASGGGTIGSVSGTAAFGAWAASVRNGAGTAGTLAGIATGIATGAGTAYTISAYVRAPVGTVIAVQAGDPALASGSVTGNGSWQRVAVSYTDSAGDAARAIVVRRVGGHLSNDHTYHVDGVQVEVGSVTTYLDGDQEGCQWVGVPHASPSVRAADQAAGGTLYPLAALGFRPETTPGYGVAPTVNILQDYAITDGAEYQRTRAEARPLTITATLTGTTTADLHRTRRRVIDTFKAGRTPTDRPARVYYWGAGGTVVGDVLYADGLDGAGDGVVSEVAAVRFVAPDPAWLDVLDQGTTLAPYTVLGSTNYIAYRDPAGRWGTMGAGGSSLGSAVRAMAPMNGTLFVGGNFAWAGGTVARAIAQWANGQWGTLPGGTLGYDGGTATAPTVLEILAAAGTLYVGGQWANAGGTRSPSIARYLGGAWGTLPGGTLYNVNPALAAETVPSVTSLVLDSTRGTLYVGGQFEQARGTTSEGLVFHNGAGYGTFGYSLTSWDAINRVASVNALARAPSGSLWFTGDVGSVQGFGTSVGGLGGFGPQGTPFAGPVDFDTNTTSGTVGQALAIGPDQRLYVGMVELTRGPSAPALRVVQSGAIPLLGSAVPTSFGGAVGQALFFSGRGELYAGVAITAINGGYTVSTGLIRWNGYSWLPPDLLLAGDFAPAAGTFDALGTLYVGGNFTGVGSAASLTTVVNRGMADSYPVLRVRHTGAGTARIFQLLNTTTGDEIYFDMAMIPGETATLDLRPESLSFTSNVQGTIINRILGGSNLTTWRLMSGTNAVSFLADNAGVVADLYWRPRHLSVDGGAEGGL